MSSLLCLFLVIIGVPPADQAPAATAAVRPIRPLSDADWFLTIRARQVLWDDGDVKLFNLGVYIEDGVASLYGAVPSEYFQERAEAALLQVKGIFLVHNRIRVHDVRREGSTPGRQFPSVDQPTSTLPGRE